MKYLIWIPAALFVAVSLVIGSICYLWGFEKRQFRKGCRYLESKTRFLEWVDKVTKRGY
jgi:hypothetical protein